MRVIYGVFELHKIALDNKKYHNYPFVVIDTVNKIAVATNGFILGIAYIEFDNEDSKDLPEKIYVSPLIWKEAVLSGATIRMTDEGLIEFRWTHPRGETESTHIMFAGSKHNLQYENIIQPDKDIERIYVSLNVKALSLLEESVILHIDPKNTENSIRIYNLEKQLIGLIQPMRIKEGEYYDL